MTNLVSSICVSPSREKARIAKMESERALAQSQLIADMASQLDSFIPSPDRVNEIWRSCEKIESPVVISTSKFDSVFNSHPIHKTCE